METLKVPTTSPWAQVLKSAILCDNVERYNCLCICCTR
uniref:Uncharacterized protein n=1 Tax=Rhizophora mucronata TaxID=61149 RepID=A0A2P2Q2N3_RHIMU